MRFLTTQTERDLEVFGCSACGWLRLHPPDRLLLREDVHAAFHQHDCADVPKPKAA